jgi:signal transduction histidine kinase
MNTLYNAFLLISILLAGGFAIYSFIRVRRQNKRLTLLKKQHQQLVAQLEALNSAHTRLLESEKYLQEVNATKDKFFSIIAHDLKSPLNTIVGFLQLLNDHVDAFIVD